MTPQDKAIEAAAKDRYGQAFAGNFLTPWDDLAEEIKVDYRNRMSANITAYLAALEAEGGAKRGRGTIYSNGTWEALGPSFATNDFPVLIIKLPE